MKYLDKLNKIISTNNSLLCVGLDPDLSKFPKHLINKSDPFFSFNKLIIDSTYDLVCAFKPNIAFYEAEGVKGITSLKKTIDYIKEKYPFVPVILDSKRSDIGNTSSFYAKAMFEYFNADATTVNPLGGFETIEPFLKYTDRGIICWCKSSNPGAGEFQDLTVNRKPLYITIAEKIAKLSKAYPNLSMFFGATWPDQLKDARKLVPHMSILVPGVGSQGADVEKLIKAGLTKDKKGLIVNVGRAIIYPSINRDFANQARALSIKMRNEINSFR